MRSRSKNSPASSKGNNGKIHLGKTRLKRKTNRRPPRCIAIRRQQVRWTRKRQPHHNRGHRSSSPNRPNGHSPHKTTRQQNRPPQTLLPNMHSHPRKRLNVHTLPKRNAPSMGGKMLLLPRIGSNLKAHLF